jgi:serine/threonine protein phosphatase PrpC
VSKKLLFLEDNRLNGLPFYVGCTACVVFVTKDHIYCANSGDSRSCLAKKLEDKKVNIIEMSQDHKPANEAEKERI